MNLQFKSLSNHSVILDVKEYIQKIIEENEDVKIYVGTDSQNSRRNSVYATVIVMHYGNHGAHALYSKELIPKIRDRYTRLWGEVERSIEVANMVRDLGFNIQNIDLDFNEDPKYNSNTVLRAAIGYVEASGYEARWKPFNAFSVRCADVLCR